MEHKLVFSDLVILSIKVWLYTPFSFGICIAGGMENTIKTRKRGGEVSIHGGDGVEQNKTPAVFRHQGTINSLDTINTLMNMAIYIVPTESVSGENRINTHSDVWTRRR